MVKRLALAGPGQPIWLERADCAVVESGQLATWIGAGRLQGVAGFDLLEGPTTLSPGGLRDLRPLAQAGHPPDEILNRLVVLRLRAIADLLLPLYEQTNGAAGFACCDLLALPSTDLLPAARSLWDLVNRPNVMLGLPATAQGLAALEAATTEGINIHVAAVGSLERYGEVLDAYLRGLERRHAAGLSLGHVASAASMDLRAVETHVGERLRAIAQDEPLLSERAQALSGRAGTALAMSAVAQYRAVLSNPGFLRLTDLGARLQRPVLFGLPRQTVPAGPAGSAEEDPAGGPILGADADTLASGQVVQDWLAGLEGDLSAPRAEFAALESLGIPSAETCARVEAAFLRSVVQRHHHWLGVVRRQAREAERELGPLLSPTRELLAQLDADRVAARLWDRDVTLWASGGAGAQEVSQRLGWLTLPDDMVDRVGAITRLAQEVHQEGLTRAVLLGMGGSSLASDVMRRSLARDGSGMQLHVLDSTDPAAVAWATRSAPAGKSLFLVSSKSGTTAEPLALLEHFWARAALALGQRSGGRFVALTDAGTPLEKLAKERGFRAVISTPTDVGGRYSALTEFGLLPAALMGIDCEALLAGGAQMARACGPMVSGAENPGLFLGALIGAAYRQGRDKLTLLADPPLAALGDWIEQLIAESSGKQGKGILPVVAEPPGPGRVYGQDRLLVYLRREGSLDSRARGWVRAGVPVVILQMAAEALGFGAEFFRWEFATAVACHCIGVNAFDQPDVQRAKTRTVELLKAFRRSGNLPQPAMLWQGGGAIVRGASAETTWSQAEDLVGVLRAILAKLRPGESLAILLYVRQTAALDRAVGALRRRLRDRHGILTTVGFGPRYLHSTGQLHKGGPDRMVYLVISAESRKDLSVPGAGYTFGVLEQAQATGDLQALLGLGRRAFGIHLSSGASLKMLLQGLEHAAAKAK